MRRITLLKQLGARKSIDKLIRDSEEPEHALKKTLGPWSLTALGIGAVIGSGIFTVIGTAISGEQFDTTSMVNTPLADGPAPVRQSPSRCFWWRSFVRLPASVMPNWRQ
ncbi:MAG: hypothetical protein ABSC76_20870 [Terracidiphilus sp.]